jgi:serine/threonine protein phosphatase PrpC
MGALRQWMESPLAEPRRRERSIVVLPKMRRDAKHRWEVCASTDIGRVRQGNEDSFDMRLEQGIFIVCDGMGGAAAGEVASKLAVESFLTELDGLAASGPPDDAAIRRAFHAAHDRVRSAAADDPTLRGMGTTLVALLLDADHNLGHLVHAGDSRCYRFRENHLEQMTHDHSFVEEQVRSGQLTAAEARRSPLRNVITRAIGSSEVTEPEIARVDLSRGDIYMLCSDGLTRDVTDDTLREILEEDGKNLSTACTEMVQEALAAGGHDNITCMLVRLL